ncbi:arylsulfatase J-like [Maniola jurtina]|uniref:arylsulfatase J-like n=1 Tax=Maniola jurtina TaxID=191418 RepID=UPI001E6881F3|nr:arylsulfatase J-like [Maniola jurtina]XP_045765791.1 arylsulfatase J-like [Maniola jurtina]XP_045765792.1 arylsulfatase J-like [Maniola jurtina]XP_045765793.1 arylsulfatase J-like [Maniola jurtina]
MFSKYMLLLFLILVSSMEGDADRPNIVFIIADDMGWDDVSFHGSDQILTPNIDLLAYTGVALERYYSHCVCTPSRSALLTGKFGHVTGMQGYPLTNGEDRALPITEKIMPQYFKEHGYATHLVGKWHVGQSRVEYLPTSRGFDSHFGHRGGYIDYYEYDLLETWNIGDVSGYDLFRNLSVAWDVQGYITDVYNEEAKAIIKSHDITKPLFLMVAHNAPHSANEQAPLQAPPDVVRAMRHIELPQRRYYAAMVKKLDDSVGDIVRALLEKGILENTIIVFVSDNGGLSSQTWANYASNWPLRGLKTTPFEGGIRVNALIWSKNLTQGQHLWKGYMHVADWLPTLSRAVDIVPPINIDGIDLWESIVSNSASKRDLIVEIDDYTGFAAIIKGDFKLITGNVIPNYSNYQGHTLRGIAGSGPSYADSIEKSVVYSVLSSLEIPFKHIDTNLRNKIKISCNLDTSSKDICYSGNGTICLYNIKEDPCESRDISAINPDLVEKLYARLQIETKRVIPRIKPHESNLNALPSLHNHVWNVWRSSDTS